MAAPSPAWNRSQVRTMDSGSDSSLFAGFQRERLGSRRASKGWSGRRRSTDRYGERDAWRESVQRIGPACGRGQYPLGRRAFPVLIYSLRELVCVR
jgi:hypothetical protein